MDATSRRIATLTAIAVLTAACGGGTSVSPPGDSGGDVPAASTAPSDSGEETGTPGTQPVQTAQFVYEPVDLETAVAQLDDPETAINGVLGILDVLGVGVYTSDGVQILAGSETGPEDLWVMAEMLPGMAASARRQGPTTRKFLETLETQLHTGLQPAELAAVYDVMTESLPEFGMSRVIHALGIGFAPDQPLTRFETWLLTLAWAPPNGTIATGSSPWPVLAAMAVFARAPIRCGPTGAGGNDPGYSLVDQYGKGAADNVGGELRDAIADGALGQWEGTAGQAAGAATFLKSLGTWVIKPITTIRDIIQTGQVALNLDVAVDAEPISTHEVHDTQGETKEKNRVQVTVTVKFLGVRVSNPDDCKFANLLGLPDPNTPIKEAQVEFRLDDKLAEHGTVRRRQGENSQRAGTDANGQIVVWYEPNYERPETAQKLGDPFLHKVQGTFTVSVNVTAAMGQLFNVFSGWEFVLDILGLNEIHGEITVGWHDPAAKVAIVQPIGGGWSGEQAIYLETCDGVHWTGAHTVKGKTQAQGTTLTQVGDSSISVTMPPGQSTGTSPVLIDTDVTGSVPGGSLENRMSQAGELTLTIDANGNANIEMDLERGAQDITVTVDGTTVHRTDVIDPTTLSWTAQVEPQECDG